VSSSAAFTFHLSLYTPWRYSFPAFKLQFKVSTLVILRRIYDIGALTHDELWNAFDNELKRLRAITRTSGGDFYLTQAARVSKRFARALFISTLGGHTLYRDAYHLLGFSNTKTFNELGNSLGVLE